MTSSGGGAFIGTVAAMSAERRALDGLASAIRSHGRRVTWAHASSRRDLAWVDSQGRLHVASARWYDEEAGALRFCIDRDLTRMTTRASVDLGVSRVHAPLRNPYFNPSTLRYLSAAEQTCHRSELDLVGSWLASWIVARETSADALAPAPPVPWVQGWSSWSYGWSALANDSVNEHRRAREALRQIPWRRRASA